MPPDIPATSIHNALGQWYDRTRRDLPWRRTRDPYAIWVSEVMLQQTRVKTVVSYYHRFLDRFPDIETLAAVDLEAVYKLWEGLGYYSRARHMHQAARIMHAQTDTRVPRDPNALRRLPGIGDYIAAAVLSIAFNRPVAAVDGNVKRVLARLFVMEAPVNQAAAHRLFQEVADRLLDRRDPGRHNQAMMELGALVCLPRRPLCHACPLQDDCQAFQAGTVSRYPVRVPRRAVDQQRWVAAVVVKQGRVLLTRRPARGLLAGFWEFPCTPLASGADPADVCTEMVRDQVGLATRSRCHVATVHHAYTHFKLHLEVFMCRWRQGRVRLNGPAAFQWLRPGRIRQLPLHKAVHKLLPALERMMHPRLDRDDGVG